MNFDDYFRKNHYETKISFTVNYRIRIGKKIYNNKDNNPRMIYYIIYKNHILFYWFHCHFCKWLGASYILLLIWYNEGIYLIYYIKIIIIPPANKQIFLGGGRGYIGITLSVRPSVYLVSATPPKRLIGFLWNFTQL